ncbi:MAG: YciI family protein, partial [Trebonia sp.]
PAHREYMARLHADGVLIAYGQFSDGSGALFIYETESLGAAEDVLALDPYQIGSVFESCRLAPWEIVRANPSLILPPSALG